MASAKTKEQYMSAWIAQVDSLNTLHFPLMDASKSTPFDFYIEIKEIQQRLKELVELAANNEFPDDPESMSQSFVLDGITGFIDNTGFIKIGPICCSLGSLSDCRLKTHAQNALEILKERSMVEGDWK